METGIIIIALSVTLLISWAIAEFFGRAKHIGFGWTFAISATTMFIGGIIALMASPSAKDKPTKGTKAHKNFAIIFFVFGILNVIQIFISKGQMGYLAPTFFILGLYLLELSNSRILNDNPKYYFSARSEKPSPINSLSKDLKGNEPTNLKKKDINFSSQKQQLDNLKNKGILSESEYIDKTNNLKESEFIQFFENLEEYRQLENLFYTGVFTKEEFDIKKEILFDAEKSKFLITQEDENLIKNSIKTIKFREKGFDFQFGVYYKYTVKLKNDFQSDIYYRKKRDKYYVNGIQGKLIEFQSKNHCLKYLIQKYYY